MLIYIEGNIGSGKSTFVRLLAKYINTFKLKNNPEPNPVLVQEPVDEWMETRDSDGQNILEKFYQDQKRWAFTFQMNSFISRAHRSQEERDKLLLEKSSESLESSISVDNRYNNLMLVERSIYTDRHCFAENCYESGNMTKMEYDIYCRWNDWLSESHNLRPDGYIYLQCDPRINCERIAKRSRDGESGIPEEYLRILHEKHESWMENEKSKTVPVLTLDVSSDFMDITRIEELAKQVSEFLEKL